MRSTDHAVAIVGAGPTGLMLASELALAGTNVVILERRPDQTLAGSRAGGLSARSLELLDQRGIVDRFLAEGQKAQVTGFAAVRLDLTGFPTRHDYGLALRQRHIERILAEWVGELGVPILRSREVMGFEQDDSGVTVALADGTSLRAGYLVGCDGGRSLVRKLANIGFPGWDATASNILAEVEVGQEPPMGVHRSPVGVYAFGRDEYEIRDGEILFANQGPVQVMVPEPLDRSAALPTLQDLRSALIDACGTDYGVHSPSWISRFGDATRQAATYRNGRVMIAGDAAHTHSPIGGQGLALGMQDAVNLGWKLAQVIEGISAESLLDTYQAERHPAAARVLRVTMAQTALARSDDRSEALRDIVREFLQTPEIRRRITAEMSGLGVHYDLGGTHPLVGRRMPDLDLSMATGTVRVFELLRDVRPILLNLGTPGSVPNVAVGERVKLVEARYDGPWELPGLCHVPAPTMVLIRPDGHVAWIGDAADSNVFEEMRMWCGSLQLR